MKSNAAQQHIADKAPRDRISILLCGEVGINVRRHLLIHSTRNFAFVDDEIEDCTIPVPPSPFAERGAGGEVLPVSPVIPPPCHWSPRPSRRFGGWPRCSSTATTRSRSAAI